MVKNAYHRVRLGDERVVEGPVVVVSGEDGNVIGWHHLDGEEANTNWIGGEIQINLK